MKPSVLSKNHSYLSSGQSNNTDYCNNGVENFSRKLKNTQRPTTASPLSQSGKPINNAPYLSVSHLSGYGNDDNLSMISSSATTAWCQE